MVYENIVKMGVALEQSNRKVDRMNKQGKEDRVAQLEEKVRGRKSSSSGKDQLQHVYQTQPSTREVPGGVHGVPRLPQEGAHE